MLSDVLAEKETKEEKKEEKKQQQPAQAKGEKKTPGASGAPKRPEKTPSSIVRLSGKDVNGSLNLKRAIDQVRGVGTSMSNALVFAIETKLNIPKTSNLGSLSEQQIESIEEVIKNPAHYGIPTYMLNHQKDMESGKNMHFVSNDLLFATRQDVNRDISNRTWRGHRHQYGQKVRGQHTRSTGRTGTTVGVVKKAEAAKAMPAKAGEKAAAPAAAPAKKEEKKPAA